LTNSSKAEEKIKFILKFNQKEKKKKKKRKKIKKKKI